MQRLLQQFRDGCLLLADSKGIFKYGLVAILLVIPLYPKFPIFNVPGTYVAVRAEDFLIFLLGIFLLARVARRNLREFLTDNLSRAILLFFGVGLLSLASAILLTKTVAVHLALLHWARRVEYILPFFIAIVAVGKTGKVRFFAEVLFVATFVAFVFGLGQIYFAWPVISTQNFEYSKGLALRWIPGSRLHSTFAGHYDLAAFMVMVLPLAWAFLFSYKKLVNKLVVAVFVIPPAFWLLLKTESRISFLAYLVGVSATLWFLRKKLLIAPVLALSVITALLFSGLGAGYRRSIETYWQKAAAARPALAQTQSLEDVNLDRKPPPPTEDRSTSIRLNIEWPRALRAFAKNPLLGTGYSSITLATDNDYLRLLGEVGIVGALSFLLVLLHLFDRLCWFFQTTTGSLKRAFIAGFLGGSIGILLNATFIDVFEASKIAIIFWTLAGIAVGAVTHKKKETV